MIKYIQECRLCHHKELVGVLTLGKQHVQGAFITKNNHYPPKRTLTNSIVRCDVKSGGCGLVQSSITVAPEILFSSYFYRSGVNESMRSHLKNVVDQLLVYNPNPKRVLDIAANDGTLLLNYPLATEKIGIDPNNIAKSDPANNITVINDFFPTIHAMSEGNDFITALAVLYDVSDPVDFVASAMGILSDEGVFCFEVMYLPSIINSLSWDTFLFEHLTHWSLSTIERLVQESGGKLINAILTPTNGGSILVFVTRQHNYKYDTQENKDRLLMLKNAEFDMVLDDEKVYDDFRYRVYKHQDKLREALKALKHDGKKICLYGVSTKANVIIQGANLEEFFSYGIERSEEKVGGSTLWGLPIKSEEEARLDADKDTVWFLGPYFFWENTIKREAEFLKKGGQILVPLPQIRLISSDGVATMV